MQMRAILVLISFSFFPALAETSSISLPAFFFRNSSVTGSESSFILESAGMRAWFRSDAISFQIHGSGTTLRFAGANPRTQIEGEDATGGHVNFITGTDTQTGLEIYSRIRYHEIYPGIDLEYEGTKRHVKSQFILAPGADPRAIRLVFDGLASIAADGSLAAKNAKAHMQPATADARNIQNT